MLKDMPVKGIVEIKTSEMINCPCCKGINFKETILTVDKKYYRCSCGCLFTKKFKILVKGLKAIDKNMKDERIVYHGTNKENAMKILKEGFKPYTCFAQNLANSIEWYGKYIFAVKLNIFSDNLNWEVTNGKKRIKPNKIVWLKKFNIKNIAIINKEKMRKELRHNVWEF